jgi:tRNA(fMet)-specific endonuclease VapC
VIRDMLDTDFVFTSSTIGLRMSKQDLSSLTVLPRDESIVCTYVSVRTELERSGTPIGAMDLSIAAHALSLNACLITNNVNEFQRVHRLQVENWVN